MLPVFFGALYSSINSNKTAEELYNTSYRFNGSSGLGVVKVLGIEEQSISDESLANDEKFYLVSTEQGFVMLKATQNQLEKFLDGRKLENGILTNLDSLNIYRKVDIIPESSSKRRGRKVNITPELMGKFVTNAENSNLIRIRVSQIISEVGVNASEDTYKNKIQEKPFYSDVYIQMLGWGYYGSLYGVTIVVGLIEIFLILGLMSKVRHNRREYEELFTTFPETERDLDILVREAEYLDEQLKVLVYKEVLIAYKSGFDFEPLSEINKITFSTVISKSRVVGYKMDIVRVDKSISFDIRLRMKGEEATEERIKEFGKYIKGQYNLKIVYNF